MNFEIANLAVTIGQSNPKSWIDILSAGLTPIIAIVTTFIAWQQWVTNERTRKQNLFEKRYDNLYYPIYVCIENISKIKEEKISDTKKNEKYEIEIQNFWKQYNKYKFLISKEVDEQLTKHYNCILDIIKKYKNQYNSQTEETEATISILALLYHFAKMEDILSKYLRIEDDNIIYKIKTFFLKKYSFKDIVNPGSNSKTESNEVK